MSTQTVQETKVLSPELVLVMRFQGGPLQNVELVFEILRFPQIRKLQNHCSPLNTQPVSEEQRHMSKLTYSLFRNFVAFRSLSAWPKVLTAHARS